jgi:CheY-like chemotaxis protein
VASNFNREITMERIGVDLGIRILVVDDSETTRKLVETVLIKYGYQCELANSGAEALQRVRQSGFDAVVTDIEMPEMDGITLTRELGQYFSDLPVLVMTSHSEDRYKEAALRAGAREFLTKPFHVSDLITKLHRMILQD